MYASKRRQRNFKRVRDTTKRANGPSNPSKRHRERLNGELETVAGLLPYEEHIIQRLDKLSVLRLAVSFLHIKAHFKACAHSSLIHGGHCPYHPLSAAYVGTTTTQPNNMIPSIIDYRIPMVDPQEPTFSLLAQKALGGFVIILSQNAEIYYVTENIETYLGFLQSDVLHQPLYEMIHSEDRENLQQSLLLNASEKLNNAHRSVVARFRCLLDNTCGFIRIEIKGRLMPLHSSQTSSSYNEILQQSEVQRYALVAVCTPFVPPLQMDPALDDPILKTKHSLDLSLNSMDNRLRILLELDESNAFFIASSSSSRLNSQSFYSLIHPDDVKFVAEAHDAVIKYCSAGLMIYRLIEPCRNTIHYVQSSFRLFFKNGKPESIGGNHRLLTEVDGNALLEKRILLKFKYVSFDDTLLQSPRIFQQQQTTINNNEVVNDLLPILNNNEFKPSTSAYKIETPFYPPANYSDNCSFNSNNYLTTNNYLKQTEQKDKKFKHLTHSEYKNTRTQSHNYIKLSNPKENLGYKKKVEKQITKRQKNKKATNEIKLTSAAKLTPLLLNQSTANILALNDTLFNSNIDLHNPINSFSKQILLQQQQNQANILSPNALHFSSTSVANAFFKPSNWKPAFNNTIKTSSIVSLNEKSNFESIENRVCNAYGRFMDAAYNNFTHLTPTVSATPNQAIELANGTDLLMNADYLGHYYQHYYPTTNYYLPQKLGNYTVTPEIDNNWNNCTYTANINTTLLNQEYQNESTATRLQLTELIDTPNNNMFSNQLSMEHLISNGYPVPLSTSKNMPTTSQTDTQNIDNCRLSNSLNEPNISIRNENHLITNIQTLKPTALSEITKNDNNLNLTAPITEMLNTNKFYDSNHFYNQNIYNTPSYTELDPQSNTTFFPNMYNNNSINNNSAAVAASAYAAVAVGNVAAANGFNFLSEVANTLLSQ